MRLLLDTHTMVWWLRDNPKLGERAKRAIADPQSSVMVSIASFWELSIKARIGKFDESGPILFKEAVDEGFEIMSVTADHLSALEGLESAKGHNDPFDHLIIAQALAEGAVLMTEDRAMTFYDVPCMVARR